MIEMMGREKAIEILQRLKEGKSEELYILDDEGGDICGQILKEQDAILACIEALKKQQWIPCSERLPSYSEKIVLATVVRRDKTWHPDPYHRLVTYTGGKWYPVPQSINLVPSHMATIEQSDGGQAEVIAWMPLPEPYREEAT